MLSATEIREEYDSVKVKYAQYVDGVDVIPLVSPTRQTRVGVLGNGRYALYLSPQALDDRSSTRKEIAAGLEMLTALRMAAA